VIRITQVKRATGDVILTLEYTQEDTSPNPTVNMDARDIEDRLKQLKALIGRPLVLQDLKEVIVAMINEAREGKTPFSQKFNWETYIGVNLEP